MKCAFGRSDRLGPRRKIRGFKWTFEGGDTYYAPAIGEYKFRTSPHRP